MFDIIEPQEHAGLTLDDYAADAKFASMVANLRTEAAQLKARLDGRVIWMVNSTATGGGVAEMLPRLIGMMG
jgi:trehalose synthase